MEVENNMKTLSFKNMYNNICTIKFKYIYNNTIIINCESKDFK